MVTVASILKIIKNIVTIKVFYSSSSDVYLYGSFYSLKAWPSRIIKKLRYLFYYKAYRSHRHIEELNKER